jgi:hypothetical protein
MIPKRIKFNSPLILSFSRKGRRDDVAPLYLMAQRVENVAEYPLPSRERVAAKRLGEGATGGQYRCTPV